MGLFDSLSKIFGKSGKAAKIGSGAGPRLAAAAKMAERRGTSIDMGTFAPVAEIAPGVTGTPMVIPAGYPQAQPVGGSIQGPPEWYPKAAPLAQPAPTLEPATRAEPLSDEDLFIEGYKTLQQNVDFVTYQDSWSIGPDRSHVEWVHYVKERKELLIGYWNGATYRYHLFPEHEARIMYNAISKGGDKDAGGVGGVWNQLRVRGTGGLGHSYPYEQISGGPPVKANPEEAPFYAPQATPADWQEGKRPDWY